MKSETLFANLRRIMIVALIALLLYNFASGSWAKVMAWNVPDNDDAMRILEVRAWLQGQGFYDLINHRLNPPNGGDIHWSRLGDLPLAFFELVLRPFLGIEMAEKTAVFVTPLALAGIFATLAGLVINTYEKSYLSYFIGVILALVTNGAMTYFQPARVDHHGLQIIFALLAMWGLVAQSKRGALVAGLSIAVSITIGFETAPIAGIMIIWAALMWWIYANRDFTIVFVISLAVFTSIGFLVNVAPSAYGIAQNDRISIAQLFPILGGCFGLLVGAVLFSYTNSKVRFMALAVIGVIVIAIAAQFPVLLEKPYYQTAPLLQDLWLKSVTETHPLYKSKMNVLISLGLFEVITSIALLIKIIAISRNPNSEKLELAKWLLLATIVIAMTLMAFFWQLRVAGLAQTFSIIAAGALFISLFKTGDLTAALLVLLVVNPMVPRIVGDIYQKMQPKDNKYAIGGGDSCRGEQAFTQLQNLPKGLIAANIDFGAQALLVTPHSVLAAPYHRNQGNLTAYQIFMAKPNDSYALIQSHKVDYVAYCTKSAETLNISRKSSGGLMDLLLKNQTPTYLEAIPTPKGSAIKVWKVKK